MQSRSTQHDPLTTQSMFRVFATAMWREIAMRFIMLWLTSLLAMVGVHYTSAASVLGQAAFDLNLPIPLAIRRTILVFVPAGVTAITAIALMIAVAAQQPLDCLQATARHTRRATLTLGITGAWIYFPITYVQGPVLGLLGAGLGAFCALLIYRHIALAKSRQAHMGKANPQQPLSEIDRMFIDAS